MPYFTKTRTVTGQVGSEVYQLGYKKRAIRYGTYITGIRLLNNRTGVICKRHNTVRLCTYPIQQTCVK